MRQLHLVESYVGIRKRKANNPRDKYCDSFPADQLDADLILALGSDSSSKPRLCAEAIRKHSSGNLVVALGEMTLTVAEALGSGCADEFILDVRQTLEKDHSGTATAGFTLGVLRASVELPDFLMLETTRRQIEQLLLFGCYPWRRGGLSHRDSTMPDYTTEPSMDVGGSASALNNAARAFIGVGTEDSGGKGWRMAIASNALRMIRSPENREAPLGWVGRKVMEPLTDGMLRQICFPERADLLLRRLDELLTPKKK